MFALEQSGIMIVKNEEIFFIPFSEDDKRSILYAPLRSKLLLVSKKVENNILSGELDFFKEKILPSLRKNKLIQVEDIKRAIENISPELAIAITDKCNLKCLYCHANANSPQKNKTISWTTLQKMIDLYFKDKFKESSKELFVSFAGGGEPTIEPKLMEKTLEYIKDISKEKKIKIKRSMATNAYFSEKIAKFVDKNFTDISISLDGPEFIQLRHRPPIKHDDNYFKIVMKNAKFFFKSNNINSAFRATVSNFSLKHMKEILDFYMIEFPGCTLGLEALNPFGRGRNCKSITTPNRKEFTQALGEAIDYVGDRIYISNAGIGKFDTIRIYFCMAVGAISWNITPDGKLWCCTRDNAPEYFCYGTFDEIKNEIIYDNEKINQIKNTNVLNFNECRDCFMKYNCAGDCPDLRVANLVDCDSNKKLGEKFFNQILLQKGGYYERYNKY